MLNHIYASLGLAYLLSYQSPIPSPRLLTQLHCWRRANSLLSCTPFFSNLFCWVVWKGKQIQARHRTASSDCNGDDMTEGNSEGHKWTVTSSLQHYHKLQTVLEWMVGKQGLPGASNINCMFGGLLWPWRFFSTLTIMEHGISIISHDGHKLIFSAGFWKKKL